MPGDPHERLRDDVRLLGELLGETLRVHEGPELYGQVEEVRALAKRARGGDPAAFAALADLLRDLPLASAVPIARAFAHFLTLANIAEQHHRIRRRREYAHAAAPQPQPGSCEETFARLHAGGVAPDALAAAVSSLRIELVLTAHPTEIVRRTLLQTHRRIADALAVRDRPDLTADEDHASLETLRREIAGAWQTAEVRDRAVTSLDEVRGGLAVFEQTLWDALPRCARLIDRALEASAGRTLPVDAAPVRFGSWIGGDRDGNPNVTPEVTRQATWMARWTAADLYLREIDALRAELSLEVATSELRAAAGMDHEPYRALLRDVAARLRATRQRAAAGIDRRDVSLPVRPYGLAAELAEPLLLCHRSLVETGNAVIAAGRLTDILRRVAAFGLTLAPLDLRQEASRHAEAIAWCARAWGLGDYEHASENARIALLVRELTTGTRTLADLPLDRSNADLPIPDSVLEVLETFRMAASLEPDSLSAYVITMTRAASDVLAVELLQKIAGSPHPQRVVPLFETAADLDRAADVLDALFSIPWYRAHVAVPPSPNAGGRRSATGRQEVMVGYSDSAKDAGRLAAAWALYRAQEQIAAVCERHGIELTLFHGRGGSIGRGGGPTYLAIQSQPPGSLNGSLRVTEQGEMIQAKFGLPDIAVRTLEVYTTSTIEATLVPAAPPPPEWHAAMDALAERARTAYRGIVYENPRFLDYFHAATPEPELTSIHVGSRPARRGGGGGVATLRAIPWQFAWTQTRLLLASWLGLEDALDEAIDRGDRDMLRTMYERWPFFRSTLDLMEMVLAKADARIAAEYNRRLVASDLQPLGCDLLARLDRATSSVLTVTGHREPVESNRVLRRSIDVRNPYVDPINLVQIELLARMRQSALAPELARAFVVTVNGIAAGMRNTG